MVSSLEVIAIELLAFSIIFMAISYFIIIRMVAVGRARASIRVERLLAISIPITFLMLIIGFLLLILATGLI